MFQVLAAAATTTTAKTTPATCGAFQFSECKTITDTLYALINTANALAVLLAVLFLAVGGIKYITSSGNKEKATEAKTLLTQVLIGLAVVLGINIIISIFTGLISGGASIVIPSAPSATAPAK